MKYLQIINEILHESASLKKKIAEHCADTIENAALLISEVFRTNGKLLICGNGGSAADAQHIATELVVRLSARFDRESLPAIALTTNSSTLTACANDYGFDRVFSRQVDALGRAGDVFIGISTSGNSPNVIHALESAQLQSMKTVSLLGESGGKMKGTADIDIIVPHTDTGRIQEGHITIGHILCEIIERELFQKQ